MSAGKIVWADPPKLRRGGARFSGAYSNPEFWEALRKRPGKWAQYPGTRNKTSASNLRVWHRDFEIVYRVDRFYVRYVGEGK